MSTVSTGCASLPLVATGYCARPAPAPAMPACLRRDGPKSAQRACADHFPLRAVRDRLLVMAVVSTSSFSSSAQRHESSVSTCGLRSCGCTSSTSLTTHRPRAAPGCVRLGYTRLVERSLVGRPHSPLRSTISPCEWCTAHGMIGRSPKSSGRAGGRRRAGACL